jgi:hypothetical protein
VVVTCLRAKKNEKNVSCRRNEEEKKIERKGQKVKISDG